MELNTPNIEKFKTALRGLNLSRAEADELIAEITLRTRIEEQGIHSFKVQVEEVIRKLAREEIAKALRPGNLKGTIFENAITLAEAQKRNQEKYASSITIPVKRGEDGKLRVDMDKYNG